MSPAPCETFPRTTTMGAAASSGKAAQVPSGAASAGGPHGSSGHAMSHTGKYSSASTAQLDKSAAAHGPVNARRRHKVAYKPPKLAGSFAGTADSSPRRIDAPASATVTAATAAAAVDRGAHHSSDGVERTYSSQLSSIMLKPKPGVFIHKCFCSLPPSP